MTMAATRSAPTLMKRDASPPIVAAALLLPLVLVAQNLELVVMPHFEH